MCDSYVIGAIKYDALFYLVKIAMDYMYILDERRVNKRMRKSSESHYSGVLNNTGPYCFDLSKVLLFIVLYNCMKWHWSL